MNGSRRDGYLHFLSLSQMPGFQECIPTCKWKGRPGGINALLIGLWL